MCVFLLSYSGGLENENFQSRSTTADGFSRRRFQPETVSAAAGIPSSPSAELRTVTDRTGGHRLIFGVVRTADTDRFTARPRPRRPTPEPPSFRPDSVHHTHRAPEQRGSAVGRFIDRSRDRGTVLLLCPFCFSSALGNHRLHFKKSSVKTGGK